jgi:hypothetical protein
LRNHFAGGKLADALGRQINLHYGLSKRQPEFLKAFPYAAGNTPKENPDNPTDRALFKDEWDTIHKTVLAHFLGAWEEV